MPISREAVRRHGVKLKSRREFREELLNTIREELDSERKLPEGLWHRAVAQGFGLLNYRTITDLQMQETVTVRQHAAFARTLLKLREYEQLLKEEDGFREPLKPEDIPLVNAPAAEHASAQKNTEQHGTDGEPDETGAGDFFGMDDPAGDEPPEAWVDEALAREFEERREAGEREIPLPATPERAEQAAMAAEDALRLEGIPAGLRRSIGRLLGRLRDDPYDDRSRMKLEWALEQAGHDRDLWRRKMMHSPGGRDRLIAMDRGGIQRVNVYRDRLQSGT